MSAPVSRPDPVAPLVQRLVASSGIVFALLLIVSLVLGDAQAPKQSAPVAEWTEYARDNEDDLRIAALVFGLAAYSFLLFLGYLRDAVGRAEMTARGFTRAGYIVLAAGAAGIAGMTIAIGTTAGAMSMEDSPPEVLRAIGGLGAGGWLLGAAALGACLVTVGLVNQATPALPAWLGWVALAGGLSFVLQLGTLLSEDDNLFGIFYPIAFLLLIVFCAGSSVTFVRDLDRAQP